MTFGSGNRCCIRLGYGTWRDKRQLWIDARFRAVKRVMQSHLFLITAFGAFIAPIRTARKVHWQRATGPRKRLPTIEELL